MKKFINSILIISIVSFGFFDIASAEGDLWDNFGDQNFYGNKAVSEKDFNQALDTKKGKKAKKEKPKIKGESFQQDNESEIINKIPDELPVVCISEAIKISDDAILPAGHYQVISEKRQNGIFLKCGD